MEGIVRGCESTGKAVNLTLKAVTLYLRDTEGTLRQSESTRKRVIGGWRGGDIGDVEKAEGDGSCGVLRCAPRPAPKVGRVRGPKRDGHTRDWLAPATSTKDERAGG